MRVTSSGVERCSRGRCFAALFAGIERLQHPVRCPCSHLLYRLANRGDSRRATAAGSTSSNPTTEQSSGMRRPGFTEASHHAQRRKIVKSKHRGERTFGGQHLLSEFQSAFKSRHWIDKISGVEKPISDQVECRLRPPHAVCRSSVAHCRTGLLDRARRRFCDGQDRAGAPSPSSASFVIDEHRTDSTPAQVAADNDDPGHDFS